MLLTSKNIRETFFTCEKFPWFFEFSYLSKINQKIYLLNINIMQVFFIKKW